MKTLKKCILLILIWGLGILFTGCEQPTSDDEAPSQSGMTTLSGQLGGSSSSSQKLSAKTVSDYTLYKVYCVTFSESPYVGEGQLDSQGRFSLQMPKSTPMGCFVNEVATNYPIATLVIQGTGGGFSGSRTSTISLSGNIDIGSVDLDLDTGMVSVPKSRVVSQLTSATNKMNLSDIHNGSYVMSCITTGNSGMDNGCADFIANDGNGVFFRVMTATSGSETVNGLGVWRSQTDFNNCGALDMTDAEKADIESNDSITFDVDGVATDVNFVNDQILCETREGGAPTSMDDPRWYYAAGPLHNNGDSYTLYVEDSFEISAGCTSHQLTTVTFTGETADSFIGNFNFSENFEEQTLGDCGNNNSSQGTFMVRFTKQ